MENSLHRSLGIIVGILVWFKVWRWLYGSIWLIRFQRILIHGGCLIVVKGYVPFPANLPKGFRIWSNQEEKKCWWVIIGEDLGIFLWMRQVMTNQNRSDDFGLIWDDKGMKDIGVCAYTDLYLCIVIFLASKKGKSSTEEGRRGKIFSLSILNIGFIKSNNSDLKEGVTIWSLWCQGFGEYWCDFLGCLYIMTKRFLVPLITIRIITERVPIQLVSQFLFFLFAGAFALRCFEGIMAQLALNKGKAAMVRTETVKISGSLLSQRIQQFSLTLIGRLMNPSVQRMDSLVTNMPKIWKLEDKVVGADLGKGTFQFNFQSEEDIQGVLQNVPYHFDGWMVSLVRWEPIISSTYPSAINFWVKVTGIPMHLWEEATLQAVGKKVGLIRDIDVDSGSLQVTINGFNPLVFQMVVPFDTGDEVVVSLEYEKLANYCKHCLRLTHDVGVCPDLKRATGRFAEDQTERRGGPRQPHLVKQAIQGQEGGWEKPRKTSAKRALEFPREENSGGFHYQMEAGDNSRQNHGRYDKNQVPLWGQKRGFPGTWAENNDATGEGVAKVSGVESSHNLQGSLPIGKGIGPAWPKPLYQPKKDSKVSQAQQDNSESAKDTQSGAETSDSVMEDVPEMLKDAPDGFKESTDDLLEDGEYQEGEVTVERATEDVPIAEEENSTLVMENGNAKGDANKQKAIGIQSHKEKEGTKANAATRVSKKGMVALPKPPADT